jgi:hypothetical protein
MKKLGLLLSCLLMNVSLSIPPATVSARSFFTEQQKHAAKKSLKIATALLATSMGILLMYLTTGDQEAIHQKLRYIAGIMEDDPKRCSDFLEKEAHNLYGGKQWRGIPSLSKFPLLSSVALTGIGLILLYNELDIPGQLKNIQKLLRHEK